MPIRLKCQCGKALNIPDNLAGKAVKCPGCGKAIKVPAGASGTAAAAAAAPKRAAPGVKSVAASRPSATAQPASMGADSLDDLFDEEGFGSNVEAVCRACRSPMKTGAVICTKCGFNSQTGERLTGHKTAGVDFSLGELALQEAAADMASAQATQDRLLGKSGMPWWMLGLILLLIVGATGIAVAAINVAKSSDGRSFNALATFLFFASAMCGLVATGANLMLLVHAFKKSLTTGLLAMFVPFYLLYYVFTNFRDTWRMFFVAVVMGAIAGGLAAAGSANM